MEKAKAFTAKDVYKRQLYNKLRAIQYGDEPDTHGWVTIVE